MTARQVNAFKGFLEAKQAELIGRIQEMRSGLAIVECGDSLDRVRGIRDREIAAQGLALEVGLLRGVDEALRRFRTGTFGRCAQCDGNIPLRRLKAVPWSEYCVRCQKMIEAAAEGKPAADQEYYAHAV